MKIMQVTQYIDYRFWVVLGCVVIGVISYVSTRNSEPDSAQGINDGWSLFKQALRVLWRRPAFALPILIVWCVYAPLILISRYQIPWHAFSYWEGLGIVFLEIAFLSYVILAGCAVMLEMIRQLEFGQTLSVGQAFKRWVERDMIRMLPLALVWAMVWFILSVLQALTSKRDKDSDNRQASLEDAARSLANIQEFSWSGVTLDALQKGGRMLVFLILVPMVWESAEFSAAVKKGFAALRGHIQDFIAGFGLTYATTGIIFLPVIIVVEAGTPHKGSPPLYHFPPEVWVGVIIYIGLAWSLSMYLEQMFMANLYNLQMNWFKAAELAKANGEKVPEFRQMPLSKLMDFPDLKIPEEPTPKKPTGSPDINPSVLPPLD
jgi:hypothetical protein